MSDFNGSWQSPLQLAMLKAQTRRHFLLGGTAGLGAMFLSASRIADAAEGEVSTLNFSRPPGSPLSLLPPQFAPRARRVIYMHMAGAPSQLELFEHKPMLTKYDGKECPASFLEGKRFAFITGVPKLMGARYPFHQAGQSGAWISDRLPHLEKHIDKICFIKSMRTEQFNHAPAQLLVQTGNARSGYPSLGTWVTYGLGTENQNLPGFIVLLSGTKPPSGGKQLWGSGFMPSVYQGVECHSHGEPVFYIKNPPEVSRPLRRNVLDAIGEINQEHYAEFGNEETVTRISQYEMAFRMQLEASNVMDISSEPEAVRARYGANPDESSFANNCLLARRLAEHGVRFIQLYHVTWDAHGGDLAQSLQTCLSDRCRETDQGISALISDLEERGMLEDTLIVWGGEFGRTSMMQGTGDPAFPGRDHHPGAFTVWLAGGGVKPGITYGETDELGYEIVKDPIDVRDLHATILYLLGFDHHKLSFAYQGLDQKLTGVKPARVVSEILV